MWCQPTDGKVAKIKNQRHIQLTVSNWYRKQKFENQ